MRWPPFVAMMVATLAACESSEKPVLNPECGAFVVCGTDACASDLVTRLDLTAPYWGSPRIRREPVLAMAGPGGGDQRVCLWRPVSSLLEVRSLANDSLFSPGADYDLDSACVILRSTGTVPYAPADFVHTPDPSSRYLRDSRTKDGTGLRIADDYIRWQVGVTYEATGNINAPPKPRPLPKYLRLLESGSSVRIAFYGDSITAAPGDAYPRLTVAALSHRYPGRVSSRNCAVGGWSTTEGLEFVGPTINSSRQDVVIIAFGMNDAAYHYSKALFKSQLLAILIRVRWRSPGTEFLLVSGMRSNPEWYRTDSTSFDEYRAAMRELEAELEGVSVVDVTSAWDDLLSRKSFYDLTANGVNHPGDFGHRIYADLVISALEP